MRILFDLIYPGYLRYYDAPIKELVARGHDVEVWFVNERKVRDGLVALESVPRVHVGGRRPRPEPEHHAVRAIRSAGDYVRYLDPAFADAAYLRRRVALKLPFGVRWLRKLDTVPAPLARLLVRLSLGLDASAPVSQTQAQFLRERAPDLVVVGPGVYVGGRQADLLDAARAAGIPTVTALASWDNLTTKGLLRGNADRVLVWNEALGREAVDLHQVPPARVHVTGAPPFDKWFGRAPSRSREEFAERVGLAPDRRYLLFVGSTARILAPRAEQEFVRALIRSLRSSDDPLLRELGVLVRPHPHHGVDWEQHDLSDLEAATIWPRAAANPVDEADRADYFDSIYHAAAVVGINTSAMIEAAIVGRPVFTVTPPEFAGTQTGTLHFKHLLPEHGGFVRRASSLDEHLTQLAAVLRDEAGTREQLRSFVARFIRPLGMERSATEAFVAELEAAAAETATESSRPNGAGRLAWRALAGIGRLDRTFGGTDAPARLSERATARSGASAWALSRVARSLERSLQRVNADALDADV